MSNQPEDNQILNQHPETIATFDSTSQPATTPTANSVDETSLTTDSQLATTPTANSVDETSLTTDSQPAITPRVNSVDETSLTTDSPKPDFYRQTMVKPNISDSNNDTKTTKEPALVEHIFTTKIQSEKFPETAIKEDILMTNLETETETLPIMTGDIAPPTIDYENYPTSLNPTPNPEPKKTGVWQVLAVFLSGMLVGSVLSLGALLAWRMYQERVNLQIRLPADVPLRPSPSPIPATPANRVPAIPPAPATPQSPASSIPSPTPTLTPTLSGVPQLASPSPSPSPSASPSPVAQTAVTERVTFEPGAIGVTLRNTLPDNKSKRYLLECNSGQSMTLTVEEGTVSAAIIAPNGEKLGTANSTTPWQGQLPSSGDYSIELSGDNKANYGVKIEVK